MYSLAPDFVAAHHFGTHGISVAQESVGAFHVAHSEGVANLRRADGNVFNILSSNAFHLEVVFLFQVGEQVEVAHAVFAEMMVIAHHDIGRLDVVDDVILDENLRRRARKFLCKVDNQHVINSELLKLAHFLFGCADETQVGAVDIEHLARMRTECDYNRLASNALRQTFHLIEERLMPEVHPVESADGDHGVGNVARFYDVVKDFHWKVEIRYCAICTALVAAPLRRLSLTIQRFIPLATL